MMELYEQLTPTKLYSSQKTRTTDANNIMCRLCGKVPESLPHVLAGCSALAQNKYLSRHNAALQVLFFEMLRELGLADTVPPWYSPVAPKPMYESVDAQAFWDVPVYGEHNHVRYNRVDARFVDHKKKTVHAVEMSCPWTENRSRKDEEKTLKYGPLRWELKQQFPGYSIKQHNIIVDVLGGWSRDVDVTMSNLFGSRGGEIILRMQKAVISRREEYGRTRRKTGEPGGKRENPEENGRTRRKKGEPGGIRENSVGRKRENQEENARTRRKKGEPGGKRENQEENGRTRRKTGEPGGIQENPVEYERTRRKTNPQGSNQLPDPLDSQR